MGIRFQEIIKRTYSVGDKFLIQGEIKTITEISERWCSSNCKFEHVRYRCDGTKLKFDDQGSYTCPFTHRTPTNLVGVPAEQTNGRW